MRRSWRTTKLCESTASQQLCLWFGHVLAAATIQGQRSFHSELPNRVATTRGWLLFNGSVYLKKYGTFKQYSLVRQHHERIIKIPEAIPMIVVSLPDPVWKNQIASGPWHETMLFHLCCHILSYFQFHFIPFHSVPGFMSFPVSEWIYFRLISRLPPQKQGEERAW